jgi:hypothetical protein
MERSDMRRWRDAIGAAARNLGLKSFSAAS